MVNTQCCSILNSRLLKLEQRDLVYICKNYRKNKSKMNQCREYLHHVIVSKKKKYSTTVKQNISASIFSYTSRNKNIWYYICIIS